MRVVPEHDMAAVRAVFDETIEELRQQDFQVEICEDHTAWCEEIEAQHPGMRLTEAFDPDFVTIVNGEFMGVLVHRGQDLVARCAIRLFETYDFVKEQVLSMRVWQNKAPIAGSLECLSAPTNLPTMRGRVCHDGGAWVDPAYRRRGLATRITRLMHARAILRWQPDWINGFVPPHIRQTTVVENAYGYSKWAPLLDGYVPVADTYGDLYISYMAFEEALALVKSQSKGSNYLR